MKNPTAGLDGLTTVGVEVKVADGVEESIKAPASVDTVDKVSIAGV